jgi:hypothetical protein
MVEDYGYVRYRPLTTPSTSEDVVAAIREMIESPGDHYWEIDADFDEGDPENLALSPIAQGFDSDAQRIIIQAVAGNVTVGYGPDGLSAVDFADLATDPPTSGMRNITGTTAEIGTAIEGVYLVEYRDAPETGLNRASSITIYLAQAGGTFAFGAHVGRVITASNASDAGLGIYGDAVFVGPPNTSASGWLFGAASTGAGTALALHSSVIRTGETRWSYAQPVDVYPAGSAILAQVGGSARPTPYTYFGLGNALPTYDAARNAGILGETKYLRAFTSAQGHLVRIGSAEASSNQAWVFVATTAGGTSNMCMLWAKEELP